MLSLLTTTLVLPISFAIGARATAIAPTKLLQRTETNCSDVHVFMARGNGEAYPGRVGAMADYICDGLDVSCDAENIEFDSSLVYCTQVYDGATSGISQITAYNARCPDAKIVLAGYSLGAQVVGDILGGGGGDFYTCTEDSVTGLSPDSTPGNAIAAALLFGDVRHNADESYNVGTGSGEDGQYPRSGTQLSNLNAFSSDLRNYCLSQDPICALGDDGNSHTTYMQVYGQAAGSWVKAKLTATTTTSASSSSTSSGSSSTGSSTSTSSSSTVTVTTITSSSSASSSTGSSSSSTGSSTGSSSSSSSASATGSGSSDTVRVGVSGTITASATLSTSTSTSTRSATTFTPFVFSDSVAATVTTSTYTPSIVGTTTSYAASTTATGSGSAVTGSGATAGGSGATASATSTSVPTYVTSSGGSLMKAPYTIGLVSLVILKALAF